MIGLIALLLISGQPAPSAAAGEAVHIAPPPPIIITLTPGPAPRQAIGGPPPIDVPSQAMTAFATYTRCVHDRFRVNMLSVHDPKEAEAAWHEAVAFCRDVRAAQLALALKRTTDTRIFGSRAAARDAARKAFDRFDDEFRLEWNPAPAGAVEGQEG